MSQKNVDSVRRVFEAFAAGDVEGLLTLLDPEIELDLSRRQLEPKVFRGHKGVREFLQGQDEVWGEQRFELEEFIDAGKNVVATVSFVSTARQSGINVPAKAWFVWETRDGFVGRATMYQSKADALDAVGPTTPDRPSPLSQ